MFSTFKKKVFSSHCEEKTFFDSLDTQTFMSEFADDNFS